MSGGPLEQSAADDDARFVRRVLLVLLTGAIAAALWLLADLLLVAFAAILVAVTLRAAAEPLQRATGIGEGWALALTGITILAVLSAGVILFGTQLAQQMGTLFERLPAALKQLSAELQLSSVIDWLTSTDNASSIGTLATRVMSWGTTAVGAVGSLIVVLVAGLYLAASPRVYREGLLKLVPPGQKPNVEATLDDCGHALKLWLEGQLIAMVIVGVLTSAGLLLIGVPSALALGFIAGLAEFIPYVGPIASAIPAVLIASTQEGDMVWWTIALYVVVQQVENNLLIPLIARRTVSIAPAIGIFAIIAIGVLFGPLGLLLGFPLVVVLDVAIRRLYVRDVLDENVEILGEPAARSVEVVNGQSRDSSGT